MGERIYITKNSIKVNNFTISQGQKIVLSLNNLFTELGDLYYMTNIFHCHFEMRNNPGISVSQFLLSDISGSSVVLIHDGSIHTPKFTINLKLYNRNAILDNQLANINFSLMRIFNGFNLTGLNINGNCCQSIELTPANFILSYGENINASNLEFLIMGIANSHFFYKSSPSTSINRFSYQDIMNNMVLFSIDEQFKPVMQIAITDGIFLTLPVIYMIDIPDVIIHPSTFTEFRVYTNLPYTHNNPTVVGSSMTGIYGIIWQSFRQNTDGYDIYMQLIDKSNQKIGSEILMSTMPIPNGGDQTLPKGVFDYNNNLIDSNSNSSTFKK